MGMVMLTRSLKELPPPSFIETGAPDHSKLGELIVDSLGNTHRGLSNDIDVAADTR
ncbi:MAG: hypothetical protein M1820_009541 [Bogoriella megaspora]|nr:MAG: hypothetical protein M1820_009541 [Bogoriella megaspora]